MSAAEQEELRIFTRHWVQIPVEEQKEELTRLKEVIEDILFEQDVAQDGKESPRKYKEIKEEDVEPTNMLIKKYNKLKYIIVMKVTEEEEKE